MLEGVTMIEIEMPVLEEEGEKLVMVK